MRFGLILLIIAGLCLPIYAAKKSSGSKKKEIVPERVEYLAADKFKIVGNLYMPPKLNKKIRVPLIIFLHGISQSKKIWHPYAVKLAEKGYAVLAIDLRGHGESVINRKEKKLFWRSFSSEDWKYIDSDVVNSIEALKTNHPQVDIAKILIVGSSMGSCVSVVTAEKLKDKVKGIVLISPFTNYKGIESRVSLVNYGDNPILIIVSKTDKSSFDASSELVKYSQGEHEIVLVKNAGHGTFMLKFEPKLEQIIYDWVDKKFPATQEMIPVEPKKAKKNKEE